jgi:hypothetical protein
MKPRDYFKTAVRIIGFVLTLHGTQYIAEFCAINIGYLRLERTDVVYYVLMGIGYIVTGLYFMRGAPHFVRYAYPDEETYEDDSVAAPPPPNEMETEQEPEISDR